MRRTITVMLAAALSGGCAMKEFSSTPVYTGTDVKFTGRIEDRVNLWPLAYWREPVGSVVWPVVSWGDDHFAFRPVYSQYRQGGSSAFVYDEFNLFWPIGQFDTKHDDYRFFPFFWGRDYGRDPYFCLFPLLWWTDEFRGVFPFFWDDEDFEHVALFPLFWADISGEETYNTLFPLYYYQSSEPGSGMASESKFWAFCGLAGYNRFKGRFTDHRFLPFYMYDDGEFYSLPYCRYRDGGRTKSRIALGLAGCDSKLDGGYESSWLLPLYYHEKDTFVTPLGEKDTFVTPLFGMAGDASWLLPFYWRDSGTFVTPLGGKSGDASWAVPLYWRDSDTFVSLPYVESRGKDGEIDSAFSIPLLSGYDRDAKTGDRLLYILCGLCGHVWNDATGGASWAFPLFYSDSESFYTLLYGRNPRRSWLFPLYFDGEERTYITPLYGRDKKDGSDWLFPLYWRDSDTFATPLFGKSGDTHWLLPVYTKSAEGFNTIPFSYWKDAQGGKRGFMALPLLSGASWSTDTAEYTWLALAALAGGTSDASGVHRSTWAFPLFYRDEDSFYSLPFGFEGGGSTTNTYFAAGLAGVHSGKRTGGWLFPLFDYEKDSAFDAKAAWLDAAKLPDDVKIWTQITTNSVWNAKKGDYDEVAGPKVFATDVSAYDNKTHLLVSDNDKSFYAHKSWSDENDYTMTLKHCLGNILAFRHESKREVKFSFDTREKLSDTEKGWSSLFLFLYNHEFREDRMAGTDYSSHKVLWKLWDWEKENGDVSLDVFPGFTYDSKKNGYSKTSFLWRFFRWENDPEKGKSVDLLFIPVWR